MIIQMNQMRMLNYDDLFDGYGDGVGFIPYGDGEGFGYDLDY